MNKSAIAALVFGGTLTACVADPYWGGYNLYSSSRNYGHAWVPVPAPSNSYGMGRSSSEDNSLPPGSYRQSCRDIIVQDDLLKVTCDGRGNHKIQSSVSISSCKSGSFSSINGYLQCDRQGKEE